MAAGQWAETGVGAVVILAAAGFLAYSLTVGGSVHPHGYEVRAKRLTRDDIYIADECFFTGTAAEVTPIRELDGRMIGAGKAGPITKALQKAFFDVVTGKDRKRRSWLTPVKKKK